MQHIIHQQKIIIRSNGTGAAQDWHRKIDANFQQKLMQRLGELFDTLMPPDRIWRIDALHMDLEGITKEGFEEQVIEQVIRGCQNVLLGISDDRVSKITPIVKETHAQESLETLLFFLNTGRLPWYSSVKDIALWEREILTGFHESQWLALADWLRGTLAADPVSGMLTDLGLRSTFISPALQRIIRQFSDRLLDELVRLGFGGIPTSPSPPILSSLPDSAGVMPNDRSAGREERLGNILGPLLSSAAGERGARSIGPAKTTPSNAAIDDALYLDNCGLVLVNPFLELYFTELGLLSARKWRDVEAANRAVLLLHWLATGQTEAAEFQLGLQKLLCGLPLDSVLPQQLELSAEEQAESEHLLRSMLGHWPPLKNTSIEGLQTAFLQRPGKLAPREGGWMLTIEKTTIDLLLAKLPWGFSTIRLPWMEGVLGVDWC